MSILHSRPSRTGASGSSMSQSASPLRPAASRAAPLARLTRADGAVAARPLPLASTTATAAATGSASTTAGTVRTGATRPRLATATRTPPAAAASSPAARGAPSYVTPSLQRASASSASPANVIGAAPSASLQRAPSLSRVGTASTATAVSRPSARLSAAAAATASPATAARRSLAGASVAAASAALPAASPSSRLASTLLRRPAAAAASRAGPSDRAALLPSTTALGRRAAATSEPASSDGANQRARMDSLQRERRAALARNSEQQRSLTSLRSQLSTNTSSSSPPASASPNLRRRLDGSNGAGVSASSSTAAAAALSVRPASPSISSTPRRASGYLATITQMQQHFEEQFGAGGVYERARATAAAASGNAATSSNARPAFGLFSSFGGPPPSIVAIPVSAASASSYFSSASAVPAALPSRPSASAVRPSPASSSSTSVRPASPSPSLPPATSSSSSSFSPPSSAAAVWSCPRCTFDNHPQLPSCEMCGISRSEAPSGVTDEQELRRGLARMGLGGLRSIDLRSEMASSSSSSSAAARRDERLHPALAGLLPNVGGRSAGNGSNYSYERRGEQLASMARANGRSSSPSSSEHSDSDESDSAVQDFTTTLRQRPRRELGSPHERETADQAARRALRARINGALSSSSSSAALSSDHAVQLPGVPDLEDLTPRVPRVADSSFFPNAPPSHLSPLSSPAAARQRVNELQRQIEEELSSIQARRSNGDVVSHSSGEANVLASSDDEKSDDEEVGVESDDASSDDEVLVDSWLPGLRSRRRASSRHPSSSSAASVSPLALPPPRSGARVEASFTPLASAAERLQRMRAARQAEGDVLDDSDDPARVRASYLPASMSLPSVPVSESNVASSAPGRVGVGVLSVGLDRTERLRAEMSFLGALFDNVRRQQASLMQRLHQEGYVDESAMQALPGLQMGLVHMLIESAWAAAANRASQDDDLLSHLPPGHAQRVEKLPTRTLAQALPDDCCICLDAMTCGAEVASLDECTHSFHASCIKQWLAKANTCPLCKRTALASNEEAVKRSENVAIPVE